MTSYPMMSRVCAIPPSELKEALHLSTYDGLLDEADAEALKAQIEEDELVCFDQLVEMLLVPDMRTAMGIASRNALYDLDKYREGRGRRFRYGARLQRSVIGYTTRASVKPSPFSFFTRIGGSQVGPEQTQQFQDVPTEVTASHLGVGARKDASSIPNPTLRMVDGRLLGWRANYVLDTTRSSMHHRGSTCKMAIRSSNSAGRHHQRYSYLTAQERSLLTNSRPK